MTSTSSAIHELMEKPQLTSLIHGFLNQLPLHEIRSSRYCQMSSGSAPFIRRRSSKPYLILNDYYKNDRFWIYFRNLLPEDRQQAMDLHNEWFPLKYPTLFFDDMCNGSLFTLAAVLVPSNAQEHVEYICGIVSIAQHVGTYIIREVRSQEDILRFRIIPEICENMFVLTTLLLNDLRTPSDSSLFFDQDVKFLTSDSNILDLVASKFPEAPKESQNLEYEPFQVQPNLHIGYITTLGICDQLRGLNIASLMMARSLEYLKMMDPEMQLVYLHVATYNLKAVRLYEKLNFRFIQELKVKNLEQKNITILRIPL